ncbi:GNAT family N-acetyltransferase [Peterkaempfera sp. SMS 1(5)a]|uniref:GNAT family N-acetyltransferase n=1 Tax=Peterkaempfera podocarpi TaxID=3232308 RepID=UPI00366C13DB
MAITEPDSALTFRDAEPADIPAVVALVESAYRGGSTGWTTESHLLGGQRTDPDGVAEVIAAADSRLLAVEWDGELLACCQLERRGATAYFGMFSVRPDRQGGGIGRAVLDEAERIARTQWGATAMEMTVIVQREDLIAWYERRGYRRTGEMLPFPYGDERFGVPRRPDLRFERLVKPLG